MTPPTIRDRISDFAALHSMRLSELIEEVAKVSPGVMHSTISVETLKMISEGVLVVGNDLLVSRTTETCIHCKGKYGKGIRRGLNGVLICDSCWCLKMQGARNTR